MHINTDYFAVQTQHCPKSAFISLMWLKTRKAKIYIFFLCQSHSFSPPPLCNCEVLGRKGREQKRRRPLFAARLLKASLSGLAAWSCVSKPRRAFHPLCRPRCVQCTGALCVEGDDTSHSVFCPELGDGGNRGRVRVGEAGRGGSGRSGGRGGTTEEGQKANLQRATALQSRDAQRLIKRYFM